MSQSTKIRHLRGLVLSMPGTSSKTQCERLREALSRYPLTTFEAMRYLDVYHVPARVLQLRKAGENIVTTWERVQTEQGETHRVGKYSLASKKGAKNV